MSITVFVKIKPVLTIQNNRDSDKRTNRPIIEYQDFQKTVCQSCCDLHDNETRQCIAENCHTNDHPCNTLEKGPTLARDREHEQSPIIASRGEVTPVSQLADAFCSVCQYLNGDDYHKCSQRFCVDVKWPYKRRFY